MTEAEWLVCKDPSPMLHDLWGATSERKLRFFLFACLLDSGRSGEEFTQMLAMGERLAEGLASEEQRRHAFPWVTDYPSHLFHAVAAIVSQLSAGWLVYGAERAARDVAFSYEPPTPDFTYDEARWQINFETERGKQCDLLRDIFGNPFRPVAFAPEWRTDTVVALARQMYDARDFSAMPILADTLQYAGRDRDVVLNYFIQQMHGSRDFSAMPILADALQDSGCDSAEVLDHCRGPGPHVRGCWVVDLVLNKG